MEINLDTIRTLWPIVVGAVLGILYTSAIHHGLNGLRGIVMKFIDKSYPEDRKEVLTAIEKLAASQEKSEEKIEDKLDEIRAAVNQSALILAEMKGRSQHERKPQSRN